MSAEKSDAPRPEALVSVAVAAARTGWEAASHEVTAYARAHDLPEETYGRLAGLATALLLERCEAQMEGYPEDPRVSMILASMWVLEQ